MGHRNPTDERGRIRVTGFDVEAVKEQADEFSWERESDTDYSLGRWGRAWRRFKRNRTALFGLSVIAIMVFVAVFARPIELAGVTIQPLSLAPYPPGESNFGALKKPPSVVHPFGTDWAGKDIFSRVMFGGRYSLSIGVVVTAFSIGVGIPLGAIAGYFGGWMDEVIMRVVDIFYAFPALVLAIAIIAVLGQGFWKLILTLILVGWIAYARIIRGEILSVKENEYVTAAKALGARDRTIIFRHIVPNAIAPVIVQGTLAIGTVVLTAAALGFLGLGLEPGSPEWGSMLSRSQSTLVQGQWWITVFPGLSIFLFVLSINLVGDGVRDALDPQGDLESDTERRTG
jgi:peptide/nickel transport system permease protein